MTNSQGISGPEKVSLRDVTKDTLQSVLDLKVSPDQEMFVATNAKSIAQAHFHENAWFRAVYAGDTPVGFVMISDIPEKGEYFLWRFMIAAEHQGKSYGRQALTLLIEHVKTRPQAKELLTSHVPGEGSPGGFYEKMGFEYTGEEYDGELLMKLRL